MHGMERARIWKPERVAATPAWRALVVTHWPAVLAVAATFVLGVPTLNYPYGPDQALFAYIGERIAHGAGLYVDVWDVKPPGIFWIYALITQIPGPEFRVLRAADLLYTGLTVVAIYALADAFWGRLAGGVAAALYGAVYVTATGYWHSAQPDSFMVLPLMLALLAHNRARGGGTAGWAVLSGALFGFSVQLRPVAVLVPAVLVVLDLRGEQAGERNGRNWWRGPAAQRAAGLVLGGVAVEAATLAWLALHGAVGEYFYAQIRFAGQYGRQGGPYSPDGVTLGNYLSGLRTGTMFIIFARLLLVAPAITALIAGILIRRERRVAEVALLALAAYVGVAIQGKFFLYHWHLLLPFLALLSGWTAAFVWQSLRAAGRTPLAAGATLAAIGALLLVLTPNVTDRAVREWDGFVRYWAQPASRSTYYDRFGLYGRGSFSYRASDQVSRYVREHTAPGDTVFVWGYDPLLYVLSKRQSPSRFLSFLPLMSTWTPRAWVDEWVDELEARRPLYIITQRGENARWVTGHNIDAVDFIPLLPRFQALLARDYVLEYRLEDYPLSRRR